MLGLASLLQRYVPFKTFCSNIHTMRIFLDVKYKRVFFPLRMRIVEGSHFKNINTLFFLWNLHYTLSLYIIFKNVTTRWIFNGCSVVPQSHYFNVMYIVNPFIRLRHKILILMSICFIKIVFSALCYLGFNKIRPKRTPEDEFEFARVSVRFWFWFWCWVFVIHIVLKYKLFLYIMW